MRSRENYSFEIVVNDTDTATDIAAALVAAVTANLEVPVTAGNTAGVVTLTAVNKGEIGNQIGLAFSGEVAGVTTSLTIFTGGAGDVFPSAIFNQIASVRYQTVISNFELVNTGDLADGLTNFLDPRFNSENDILDGVAILSLTDSFANLTTIITANDSPSWPRKNPRPRLPPRRAKPPRKVRLDGQKPRVPPSQSLKLQV